MRIAKIGKKQFAFELEWTDSFGGDAPETVRERLGAGTPASYLVLKGEDDVEILGFAENTSPLKGRVYSYAAAIAATGKDGIYVGPTEPGKLWYTVISNGLVVASTDLSMPAMEVANAVHVLSNTYGSTIYVADGVELDYFDNAVVFDPVGIVAKTKTKPMRTIGGAGSNPAGALLLMAVVGVMGYAGWYMYLRKPESMTDPAVIAANVKSAYLSSMRSMVGSLPANPAWVLSAFDHSRESFPGTIGGWALDEVRCTHQVCTGHYSRIKDSRVFALTPMAEHFGSDSVQVQPDQNSLVATVPLELPSRDFSDDDILMPPSADVSSFDSIGRIGMYFGTVAIEGETTIELLGEGVTSPPEANGFVRETFATRYDSHIDRLVVGGLADLMDESDFIAKHINYSLGIGALPAVWRIEWTRIHGGDVR